ncbi:hypothetical protein NL676_015139 [Syzygium grande]|nr:hypothetical protein NL676_015139 [Syzygium grande]
MLRLRPIVPKLVTGEPVSGAGNLPQIKRWLTVKRRAKRRYVRVWKNYSQCKRRSRSQARGRCRSDTVLTLQLLPEKAEPRQSMVAGFSLDLIPMIITPREVSWTDCPRPLKFNANGENSWDWTMVNLLKRAVTVSWQTRRGSASIPA